jgi:hypothetical protein
MQRNSRKPRDRWQEIEDALKQQCDENDAAKKKIPPKGGKKERGGKPTPRSGPSSNGVGHHHQGNPVSPAGDVPDGDALPMREATSGKRRTITWLWKSRLAWRSVAILQGEKGSGKSSWLRAIAADVTGGPRLPGESTKRRVAGTVLWFAGEEDLQERVEPGLLAAGANLKHCRFADDQGEDSDTLRLPGDCHRLIAMIRAVKAVLVILDPFLAFIDGAADIEGGSVAARQFMRRVRHIAYETGALLILTRNLTKNCTHGALDAGRGSGEIGNAVRVVLHTHTLPQTPGFYGLAVAAGNDGSPAPTLEYTIVDGDGAGIVRVGGHSSLTADELVSGDDGDLDRSLLDEAKAIIRQALPKGELLASVFVLLGQRNGISLRTMQLAAKRLGVTHRKDGVRENLQWFWVAPKGGYK